MIGTLRVNRKYMMKNIEIYVIIPTIFNNSVPTVMLTIGLSLPQEFNNNRLIHMYAQSHGDRCTGKVGHTLSVDISLLNTCTPSVSWPTLSVTPA